MLVKDISFVFQRLVFKRLYFTMFSFRFLKCITNFYSIWEVFSVRIFLFTIHMLDMSQENC